MSENAEMKPENGFDRLDRRIGMIWSRIMGTVLGFVGLYVASRTFRADDFTIGGYWPALVLIVVLWLMTWRCWRSRESMLSMLSDVGGDRQSKA